MFCNDFLMEETSQADARCFDARGWRSPCVVCYRRVDAHAHELSENLASPKDDAPHVSLNQKVATYAKHALHAAASLAAAHAGKSEQSSGAADKEKAEKADPAAGVGRTVPAATAPLPAAAHAAQQQQQQQSQSQSGPSRRAKWRYCARSTVPGVVFDARTGVPEKKRRDSRVSRLLSRSVYDMESVLEKTPPSYSRALSRGERGRNVYRIVYPIFFSSSRLGNV